jgi:hypothetical protein
MDLGDVLGRCEALSNHSHSILNLADKIIQKQRHTEIPAPSIPCPIPWNRLGLADTLRCTSSALTSIQGQGTPWQASLSKISSGVSPFSKPAHGITALAYTVSERYR